MTAGHDVLLPAVLRGSQEETFPLFVNEPTKKRMTMGSPRRVTLKDIAKVAGVSSATVSMALNDKGSLTPLRREAIKKLAKDMGYVPSSIARALREKKRSSSAWSTPT